MPFNLCNGRTGNTASQKVFRNYSLPTSSPGLSFVNRYRVSSGLSLHDLVGAAFGSMTLSIACTRALTVMTAKTLFHATDIPLSILALGPVSTYRFVSLLFRIPSTSLSAITKQLKFEGTFCSLFTFPPSLTPRHICPLRIFFTLRCWVCIKHSFRNALPTHL